MLISVTLSMTPTLSTIAVSVTVASHSVRRLPPAAFCGGEAAVRLARRLRGGSIILIVYVIVTGGILCSSQSDVYLLLLSQLTIILTSREGWQAESTYALQQTCAAHAQGCISQWLS